MNTIAVKFVKWDIPALTTLAGSRVYGLRERLDKGDKISREEKNWITENVNKNAYFKSAIPLSGWRFDFSDILKTYVVKQYGHYQEYRAVDKTSLHTMLYGRIEHIIEI